MIEPFYFKSKLNILFGIYYPPSGQRQSDTGVVLCYPMGQEYIRSHRAFVHLAKLLAGAGYHVLKFDYSCSGDSYGDCKDVDLDQWISDITTAISELVGGCSLWKVYLAGLRLGATLAAMVTKGRTGIDGVVLWNPVIKGGEYLNEIRQAHSQWFAGSFSKQKTTGKPISSEQILGFPLTDNLKRQLERIDLLTIKDGLPPHVLLIENERNDTVACFQQHLKHRGYSFDYACIPSPKVWLKGGNEQSKGLVPPETLRYIKEWLLDRDRIC